MDVAILSGHAVRTKMVEGWRIRPPPPASEEMQLDTIRMVLHELNLAIAPRSHRIEAITNVIKEFDHNDELLHDQELDLQADKILFQKLALLYSIDKGSEEVGLIASSLELVYRASRARVALSFSEIGNAILPLFIDMIKAPMDDFPDSRKSAESDGPDECTTDSSKHDRPTGPRFVSSASAKGDQLLSKDISLDQSNPKRFVEPSDFNNCDDMQDSALTMDFDDPPNSSDSLTVDFESHGESHRKDNVEASEAIHDLDWKDQSQGRTEKSDPPDEEDAMETHSNIVNNSEKIIGGHKSLNEYKHNPPDDSVSLTEAISTPASASDPEDDTLSNLKIKDRISGSIISHVEVESTFSTVKPKTTNEKTKRTELGVSFSAEVKNNIKEYRWNGTNILAVQKVVKVMRYFSRVLSAMIPMAHSTGLLDALIFQVQNKQKHIHRYDDGTLRIFSLIRVDSIATIVNLACAEENKVMMIQHPNLLDAVISVANQDTSEEAREHSAVVLLNLAHTDDNKLLIAGQSYLLETLVKLVKDSSPFTRRYASAALFTLACVPENTSRLIQFENGQVLSALTGVLMNDPVEEARINASEALFNMARNNTETTVELFGDHPNALQALSQAVLTDYSADVRAYAARALEWLAADIHYPMSCHESLLEALTIASAWTKTSYIAEAMKTQSMVEENWESMICHDGLLDALANLACLESMNDIEVRSSAIETIKRLTKEKSTRFIMATHQGIMTALTKSAFSPSASYPFNDDEIQANMQTKSVLKSLTDTL